jgi:uncharacterized protein YegP (UPF0339 family)
MSASVRRVEIVENAGGEWFFRAVAANGETVAMSEMYTRRESAAGEASKLWPGVEVVDSPFERGGEAE